MTISKAAIIFRTLCVSIFAYKATECLVHYLQYETVNNQAYDRQENYPIPEICLSSPLYAVDRLENVLNISKTGYQKQGIWRTNSSANNAQAVYEFVSPRLSDIVSSIKIRRRTDKMRDTYEYITTTTLQLENGTGPEGLNIVYLDYYDEFKISCLNISKELISAGIEKIYIYTKARFRLTIISPGNFYTFERKRNSMEISPGFNYDYQVYHSISVALSLDKAPCNVDMFGKEDHCRLNYTNHKIVDKFKCTAPWLLDFARTTNQDAIICDSKLSKEANEVFAAHRYVPSNACEKPCTTMEVRSSLVGRTVNTKNELQLTFSKSMMVSREMLAVTILRLVGELGGYLGLTLGLSLLGMEDTIFGTWTKLREGKKESP